MKHSLFVRLLMRLPHTWLTKIEYDVETAKELQWERENSPRFEHEEGSVGAIAEADARRILPRLAQHLCASSPYLDLIDQGPMPAGMGDVIRPEPEWPDVIGSTDTRPAPKTIAEARERLGLGEDEIALRMELPHQEPET